MNIKKKRKRLEIINAVQAERMKKFLQKDVHNSVINSNKVEKVNVDKFSINLSNQPVPVEPTIENIHCESRNETNISAPLDTFDLEDPAKWPVLDSKVIQIIIEKGPVQITDYNFPITGKRKFNPSSYFRILQNGEKISRPWLLYSRTKDAVFCFCCILFSNAQTKNQEHSLTSTGYKDWAHLSRLLKEHEGSMSHIICFNKWKDLDTGLKTQKTVDEHIQRQMSQETEHWRNVLKRLVIFAQYLAGQNLAFRGNSDKLYENDNGNFLKLLETVSKFDLVLAEHIRRIQSDETNSTYLSKNIQNEIIHLLSNAVRNKIIVKIKTARYYSIIVDCTPDASKTEQLSLTVRILEQNGQIFEIKEYFLGFLIASDCTGSGLTDLILKELEKYDILIENCRGQGYDNGANMKGKNSGVQAKIKSYEPRAFYVPCSTHSLNLIISDAVQCSSIAIDFFNTVEKLYVFFSGSSKRWETLKNNLPNLTLKPLCTTRWESRIDSIRPLVRNLEQIDNALIELSEKEDTLSRHMAQTLSNKIISFEFICCVIIWYEILDKINITSKYLQSSNICLQTAVSLLNSTKAFLCELRSDQKFQDFVEKARLVAQSLDVPDKFPDSLVNRPRRKKNFFSYEGNDEPILDPEKKFKVEFYFKVVDKAIISISERFEQIQEHNNDFLFLYNIEKSHKNDSQLKTDCDSLEKKLTNGNISDISGDDLYREIKILKTLLTEEEISPNSLLQYIYKKNLETAFPNIVIALKIALTLPITVASGERSFSKLKLIKNYLRTTMTQERLVDLAILSIEKELAETLDYEEFINDFAKIKARRVQLVK